MRLPYCANSLGIATAEARSLGQNDEAAEENRCRARMGLSW